MDKPYRWPSIRGMCLSVLAVGIAIGAPALGRSFWDAPPTRGLYRPTAYTLSRGEAQIQFFAFASPTNPLSFFEFEYGLSDALQLGTRPVSAAFGDIRIFGKYHVGTTGPVSLAIPFSAEFLVPTFSWGVRGGWMLSWRVLPFLTLHPGLDLAFAPAVGLDPYLGTDLDLWSNLKLVLELDGEEPHLDLGILARLLGIAEIRADFSLPWSGLRISVSGRF